MNQEIKKIYDHVSGVIEEELNDDEQYIKIKEQLNIPKNTSVNSLLVQVVEDIYELYEGNIELTQQKFFEAGYKIGRQETHQF
ncbi:MAG: hypothetical protein FWF46_05940 [Oscillospiraceae bacterium]|nr:hypothetical protein [Oscillospiraceae bacterium]